MTAGLIVLALHGGFWSIGKPASVESVCVGLRHQGVACLSVPYALGDYPQAIRDVRAAVRARPEQRIVLYGFSAGGTLAAYLAAHGEVDAAMVEAAPADLTRWGNQAVYANVKITGQLARWSPRRWQWTRVAPILGLYSHTDPIVAFSQAGRLAAQTGARIITKRLPGHRTERTYDRVLARWARTGR